jgi:hypothetical protein
MKKIKEIMQFFEGVLLNAIKNEENKGNNAIFGMFTFLLYVHWRSLACSGVP